MRVSEIRVKRIRVNQGFSVHCKVIIGRNPIEANANTIAI